MISKPRLLLTCGDPNGIGPEIALKILNNNTKNNSYSLKIICPKNILAHYSKKFNLHLPDNNSILDIEDYNFKVKEGETNETAGKIAGESIIEGMKLCLNNEFDALITSPISKKSLNLGGFSYPGHTEFLQDITRSKNAVMILYSKYITVSPLTIHIPLKEIPKKLNKELLIQNIKIIYDSLKNNFRIKNSKIAILSLNPHSGDSGILGTEEINIINPVIEEIQNKSMNIFGAFPADGFFGSQNYKNFDIIIGMYHDQILIPFKLLSKGLGVNFTAGLPIIRTSPSHGTAFDIAGKGIAKISSTVEAIKLAIKLVKNK